MYKREKLCIINSTITSDFAHNMNTLCCILLLIAIMEKCFGALEPMLHQCINDKIQPSADKMIHCSDDKSNDEYITKPEKGKREATENVEGLRLHTVLHSSTHNQSFFTSPSGAFQRAISLFSKAFLVKPRRSRLTLQPKCSKTIRSGVNSGRCKKIDKSALECGPFEIPDNLIGAGVECKDKAGSCKSKGSSGAGVLADFILFAGAIESECARYGSSVLAFAAVCGTDDVHRRPSVGFINVCYQNVLNSVSSLNDEVVYNILLHEMSHAFGFTSVAMTTLFRNQQGNLYNPVSQFRFNGRTIPGITSPKVLEYARQYYNCPTLQYVPLEDGGGSGSASSHWEARVLNHEMLMAFLSPDYMVFSNFTWAFFEDSGWYKVNYAYTNTIQTGLEMKWGKGLGCDFVLKPCTDKSAFPYSCQTHGCTFDRIAKGVCNSYSQFFDGCRVVLPSRGGSCIHDGIQASTGINEIFGKTSRCFEHRSVNRISASSSVACLNTSVIHHPSSGTTAYKVESSRNSVWCEEGEHEIIDGRFIYCPVTEEITVQYPIIQTIPVLPRQLCHNDCLDCSKPGDSTKCSSCKSGFQLDGPVPNTCCNPLQSGDCKSIKTTSCTNGNVRLVGGSTQYEGNVEVCSNGQWGSVCHNNWYTLEAIVVCKQLGYSSLGAKSTCCSRFKQEARQLPEVVMDRFGCTGSEDRLTQCSHDNSRLSYCSNTTTAGVQCPGPCEDGDVKLVSYYGSERAVNGRVTVCHKSKFKPLCDYGWDNKAASLFCKHLGQSPFGMIITKGNTLHSSLLTTGDSISISNCDGKNVFEECQIKKTRNCPNSVAGVVCQPAHVSADDCTHGALRLLGSDTHSSSEGRLEVCINNVWGTVCSYSWSSSDAVVACKQLGFSDGSVVSSGSNLPYGRGSGPVLMSFVNCSGSEKKLIDCFSHYYSYCPSPATVQCR